MVTILVNFVNIGANDLRQPQEIARHAVCYKQTIQTKITSKTKSAALMKYYNHIH